MVAIYIFDGVTMKISNKSVFVFSYKESMRDELVGGRVGEEGLRGVERGLGACLDHSGCLTS